MTAGGQVEVPSRSQSEGERGESRSSGISSVAFSNTAKWLIVVGVTILAIAFLLHVRTILYPFIWAILAAYVFMPVVNYLNDNLAIPRFLAVAMLYVVFLSLVILASRYLFPWIATQMTFFVEDLPKLQGSLVSKVGPRPLGIDINQLVTQIGRNLSGVTSNPKSAEKLLQSAFSTTIRVLIFLFSTFYLLMDGPRIRRNLVRVIPVAYRPELLRLSGQINATWTNYIRGELILFGIMTTASFVGLELLRVPGAVPLALATGVLELLPIVGPITAGALAVMVAYLNGTNPFGWSQVTYGLVVAAMYLVFRETEDYVVVPRVLGRSVKLHPLVILFALACGGVIAGLLGLLVAVPLAASIKIVGAYLYDKLVPQRPEFTDIHTVPTDGL